MVGSGVHRDRAAPARNIQTVIDEKQSRLLKKHEACKEHWSLKKAYIVKQLENQSLLFRRKADLERQLVELNKQLDDADEAFYNSVEWTTTLAFRDALLTTEQVDSEVQKFVDEAIEHPVQDLLKKRVCEEDAYETNEPPKKKTNTLADFIVVDENHVRAKKWNNQLLEEMLILDDDAPPVLNNAGHDICKNCKSPVQLASNGCLLTCTQCSMTFPYNDTSTASMSYGSDFKITRSDYERRSHFQEWLTNFQAKETLVVSNKVISAVMEWLYRNGHTDPNNVTLTLVRKALQDLALPAMYKHVTQITCRITGKEPPRLTPDEEETLKTMFNLLQTPFQRYKTKSRRNFLSYPYCMIQFCIIQGWDHYISCFRSLKGNDKLTWSDNLFEKCCSDLNWSYSPLSLRCNRQETIL
jgi:hypothetical protein